MKTTVANSPNIDLCPHLLFVRGQVHRIVRSFTRAIDRERACVEAADLSHLLTQVIVPLCRKAQGDDQAREYERLAASLQYLAAGALTLDANYPDDHGQQLILEKLDNLELILTAIVGHRHSVGRAVEICKEARS